MPLYRVTTRRPSGKPSQWETNDIEEARRCARNARLALGPRANVRITVVPIIDPFSPFDAAACAATWEAFQNGTIN